MAESLLGCYRALDLTDEKGVFCSKILTDLGVDTIKIEKPGGDSTRNIGPFYHDTPDPEKSLYWFANNTNKRSITLDITKPRGKELFEQLVKTADFIIESFSPGFLERHGLDYKNLSKINPRTIVTSITPFGQTGPYSNLKGSDLVTQAMGVLLWQTGDRDRAPVRTSIPQAFAHAGADAAEATMIAHYYREMTGKGQQVDVSIMESVLWVAGRAVPFWDALKTDVIRAGRFWDRPGRRFPAIWDCKNGYVTFLIQGGVAGDRTNKSIMQWMDSYNLAPDYMKETDWENWDWDKVTQAELDIYTEAVTEFFKTRTAEELEEGAIERGIMLNKVCDSADSRASVQLEARDFWTSVEHEELNDTITYPGPFAKFSLTPIDPPHRAPRVGEHNQEIYENELGLTPRELAELQTQGVI